jgi:cytochrome P450
MALRLPNIARDRRSSLKLPPGPKGRFLLGGTLEFSRDWLGFLVRCAREYDDIVFLRLLGTPVCLLYRPDYIESVLVTNQANFVKSKDYRAMRRVLGNGLLTSEGELWRHQRKLAQPAFRHEHISRYGEVMVSYAERMLDGWRDGERRDIHQEMMRLTLEIVAKALFDADVSRDAKEVGASLEILVREFIGLANIAFLLPDGFPIPGSRKLRRAVRRLDDIVYGMIRERRASGARPGDLLDMLLYAADEDGRPMSDRQLRDEVTTLFLAGHETTAIALSWTWYLLAQHPEVENRLVEDLCRALGGRSPAATDLGQLRYAEMVVKESMRLYPPAWGIGRQALAPFEIGGYRLPAGTNVFLSQWVTHRDPRYFPDPERFDPERWRDDPARSGALPRFAYFPFGGGPRVCIGASFAMMEATLLLAAIAPKFKLRLIPGQQVKPFPSITLRPKDGIQMTLARR